VSHRKERSKSPRSHSTHNKGAVISVGFHQRLSAYATAAAAAGVGLLATATPANADIVFTPTHIVFTAGQVFIDLDHDGVNDFILSIYNFSSHDRRLAAQGIPYQNGVLGYSSGPSYPPLALVAGARIGGGAGEHGFFWHHPASAVNVQADRFGTIIERPFANAGDRYLGLKFRINGKIHYGWALLNARAGGVDHRRPWINVTMKGYAYNSVAGETIHAGQISANAKNEAVPEAGTLAALALGWPVWRRKEEEERSSSGPISNSGE